MTTPLCSDCHGAYACLGCGSLLRKKLISEPAPNVWGSPGVRQYLEAIRDGMAYTTTFPRGPQGGALLDLGDGNRLEVFLPYTDDATGDLLPFMPMPYPARSRVHDAGRGKAPTPAQIEACRAGSCQCRETVTGWILPRPVIRYLLGVSDSFLAEHSRDFPGVQADWRVRVSTPVFMTEVIFNPEFRFPTREAARAARAAREEARKCRPPRPNGRWPSRPRRK